MAHDQHAKAWIQGIKAARKHVDDLVDPYYERFIKKNPPGVPTKKDAEEYERLVKQAKQMADVMRADLDECSQAMASFAGRHESPLKPDHVTSRGGGRRSA